MLYRETDMNERSIGAADYQDLPRPIAAMAKNFASGSRTPPHRHKRAQLVFAAHGTMVVWTAQGSWVVPPNRAVWMPAGTEHAIRMNGRVAMRTLYVRADLAAAMPAKCCVIAVSPLMRELILRAVELPLLYDEAGAAGRVMALILDEMRVLPVLPLHLPWPEDTRLEPHPRAALSPRDRHELRRVAPTGAAGRCAGPACQWAAGGRCRARSRLPEPERLHQHVPPRSRPCADALFHGRLARCWRVSLLPRAGVWQYIWPTMPHPAAVSP